MAERYSTSLVTLPLGKMAVTVPLTSPPEPKESTPVMASGNWNGGVVAGLSIQPW